MPMARFSSRSRFIPRRPELGLNRIVALCMRRLASFEFSAGPHSHVPRLAGMRLASGCFRAKSALCFRAKFWGVLRITIDVRRVHLQEVCMKLLTCGVQAAASRVSTLRGLFAVAIIFGLTIMAAAQDHAMGAAKPVTMMTGLGDLHHPVSTKNASAQEFFDQGLRLIYAFNHDEAARSFQKAAELDPKLAMAYWGIAEAVGPNYNDPASEDRFKRAHEAIQKAVDLSGNASEAERGYILAMAKRFPADPKSDLRKAAEDYRDAMREVVKNNPDDL